MKKKIIICVLSCVLLIQAVALTVIYSRLENHNGYIWNTGLSKTPFIEILNPNSKTKTVNELLEAAGAEYAEQAKQTVQAEQYKQNKYFAEKEEFRDKYFEGIRWHTSVIENNQETVKVRMTAFDLFSGNEIMTQELWIDMSGKEPVITTAS